MIITQTPFRMSFFGGGTDMESFFKEYGGAVLSTTFDKYCYVNVRHLPRFFDYSTELSYSKTERVTDINDIQHPAIRNAMKMLDMHEIRLTYEADLPARSGLGTSSSFAVGMLNAFYALKGKYIKIPEIARALDVQGVQTPQVQMAKKKRSRTKNKWQDSTIRSILKNPLYIGKCTLTLAKAKRELEVPAIVSKTEFQKAQKKLESTRLPSRKKARKKPNLLFKKIYDKESGKGLLCRTSEDESQQIYSFDKGYRCFSGKAPFIESEKIFREILSALEKEKMQAAHIDRVLDLNPEKVKQCMDAGLLQYRKRANEIVARLMAKDDERTAVYREYEHGSISPEQVDEYEHQYQVAVQKQEADFKKVMLAVNDIEKAFSHGNPWLMKFRAISIPEKLERTHLKEWLDHVWIVDFEQVEVILQESKWKGFFPEEWLNNGEEDCNGKKE